MLHSVPRHSGLLILAMLQLALMARPAHASEAFRTGQTALQLGNAVDAAAIRPQSISSAPLTTRAASNAKTTKSALGRSAKQSSKAVAKKVFLPLRIRLADLSHPVVLFKSVQRHVWSGTADAQINDDYPGQQERVGRVFDVGLNAIATYRLTDSTTRLASQDQSLDRYGVPSKYVSPESASRISATQLQVRMSEEWSLLYELDRLDADIGADKLSWGLGLRRAF